LEQNTIASGTSSKSSKLIHGGLRYLETGQLSLVRECLKERLLLLKRAPDLVKLRPFFIPIFPETRRRPGMIRIGLSMYAVLGGFCKDGRFCTVSKSKWLTLDGLKQDKLSHVFLYYDAQTDDKKLTQAVVASAQKLGADVLTNAELINASSRTNAWEITYKTEQTHIVHSKIIVNAAGPWVNQVLSRIDSDVGEVGIDWVQGTHVIVKGEITQGIYYIESPDDGRAVFVMPWYGNTMIGTTETLYQGRLAEIHPLQSEIDYLLRTYSYYFPQRSVEFLDAFAGVRVLPASESNPFQRSRDTILKVDDENNPTLLNIYGGKLTAAHATAEAVMKKLQFVLPVPTKNIDLSEVALS